MEGTSEPVIPIPDAVACGPQSPHWVRGAMPPDGTGYPPAPLRKVVAYSGQTPAPNPAHTTDHKPDPELIRAVQNDPGKV